MNFSSFKLLAALIVLLAAVQFPLLARGSSEPPSSEGELSEEEQDEQEKHEKQEEGVLAPDPAVLIETLENGLTYYIRENTEPENRAFLRLVVDAGSTLEDEDQLGLAHFVEHMAFLGTEEFEKDEIVAYLESLGMRFGPDVNAYTGFDETVYMLQIPADDPEKLETGLHILQQWAHAVSFEPEQIESERGVIQEEWRTRLGAAQRIRDRQLPVLLRDSRYAERLPIGKPEVFMEAGREQLLRFYKQWYRPELMAVIAVGDFEADRIETLIQEYFGRIEPHSERNHERPERTRYEVPKHEETLYTLESDPEANQTSVAIYSKYDHEPLQTEQQYRRLLEDRLFAIAMNNRFSEIAREPEAPFLRAAAGRGRLVRPVEARILQASVEEDAVLSGFEALVTEAERARRHGFGEAELERARRELRRAMLNAYNERENTPSSVFAAEYARHFLQREAIPGIEREWELTRRFLPEIGAEELHDRAEAFFRRENRVIAVSAAETEDLAMPSEAEIETVLEEVTLRDLEPLLDDEELDELMTAAPEAGRILEERELEAVEAYEWRLSNGVTVVAKPTEFRSDEVRLKAFRYGGASLVEDEDYYAARFGPDVAIASGVERFTRTELDRVLAGRDVSLEPYIARYDHGLEGRSSVDDLEQLFQLVHLQLMSPRLDDSAFETVMRRERSRLRNREAQPDAVFIDRVHEILSAGDIRRAPIPLEAVENLSFTRTAELYREIHTDPAGLKVFVVGAFEPERLRRYIETYLAGIPSTGETPERVPRPSPLPRGIVEDKVYSGSDPASRVALVLTGDHEWSRETNYAFRSLTDALRLELREVIRERESGTYSVGVSGSLAQFPSPRYQFSVLFGTSPERAEELGDLVLEELRVFAEEGPSDSLVARVRETQRRDHESDLRSNRFWINALRNSYYYEHPVERIVEYPELVDGLDAETIQEAARRHLDLENYVRVILFPAPKE